MPVKKALSLVAATALAATTLSIPPAGAAEQPQNYDELMEVYLSSKDSLDISVDVQGDKCFITTTYDGESEVVTMTRAEAREEVAKAKKFSNDEEVRKIDEDVAAALSEESAQALADIALWGAKAYGPPARACAEGKDMSPTSSKAHTLFSSVNGDLSPEGIGIIVGSTVVLLGLLAAIAQFALPAINPQIAALLPF